MSLLQLNPPSPAAPKVVILTTPSAAKDDNLIQWWKSNQNNETSVSVIILLDNYITHGGLLLMAYIAVWDGAVNTIYIQMILFYGGRESVDIMECYALVCHLLRQVDDFAYFVLVMFVLSWFCRRVSWLWWAPCISMLYYRNRKEAYHVSTVLHMQLVRAIGL